MRARWLFYAAALTVWIVGLAIVLEIPSIPAVDCSGEGYFAPCVPTPGDDRIPLRLAIGGGTLALAFLIAGVGALLGRRSEEVAAPGSPATTGARGLSA